MCTLSLIGDAVMMLTTQYNRGLTGFRLYEGLPVNHDPVQRVGYLVVLDVYCDIGSVHQILCVLYL